MNQFMSQDKVQEIREKYPVGTRIELDNMSGESDMPSGLQGTVAYVDDAGQVGMKWDNGRSLSLVPFEDSFHIIREEENNKIKVLVIEPQKEPYMKEIENDYRAMQQIVNGCIEFVPLPDGECHLYCNDEGKLDGLPGNRRLDNGEIICGTFFICADDGEGADISLTDEQFERYTQRFKNAEEFTSEEAHSYEVIIKGANSSEDFLKMLGISPDNEDELER